jgi:hypothetical protein
MRQCTYGTQSHASVSTGRLVPSARIATVPRILLRELNRILQISMRCNESKYRLQRIRLVYLFMCAPGSTLSGIHEASHALAKIDWLMSGLITSI